MTRQQEMEVIARPSTQALVEGLERVVSDGETAYVRSAYQEVEMSGDVLAYLMDIVDETRRENSFVSGVSTRGAIALYKASQAIAALRGRTYVIPEDVKYMAPYVLGHRVSLGSGSRAVDGESFIRKIAEQVRVPLETMG